MELKGGFYVSILDTLLLLHYLKLYLSSIAVRDWDKLNLKRCPDILVQKFLIKRGGRPSPKVSDYIG